MQNHTLLHLAICNADCGSYYKPSSAGGDLLLVCLSHSFSMFIKLPHNAAQKAAQVNSSIDAKAVTMQFSIKGQLSDLSAPSEPRN